MKLTFILKVRSQKSETQAFTGNLKVILSQADYFMKKSFFISSDILKIFSLKNEKTKNGTQNLV